ncbi:MAG: E3 binding domain-containing protein, partial [Gammaproteobacteria bacterium]|nr:E3 binding domain-containing protein [Gammaproteobacteria bacterium]
MSKQQVTVPDIGGAEGAEVIEVLVAVGDQVAVDQGLIVLESDKASMEIPSSAAGTVVELLVAEGQQLAEGAPVAVIEVAGGDDVTTPVDSPATADSDEAVAPAPEPAHVPEEQPPKESGGSPAPASAEQTVVVPDIGTDEAVELIEVCVEVGATVAEGDSLVVLESDKASMEVPSPLGGEVIELLVKSGGQVKQGDPLLLLRAASPAKERVASSPKPAPAASRTVAPPPAAKEPAAKPSVDKEPAGKESSSIYAGPAVRKLAREFGVTLQQVTGSGPRGRILKEDLQQFVQNALSAKPGAATTGAGIPAIPDIDFSKFGPVEVTRRSKLDKLTAANM